MKKAIFGILISAVALPSAMGQILAEVPVHAKPVWQQVQSVAEAPGAQIAVRSLSTNQVIGALPVESTFLSFGTNGQIVTMAFNGEMGYVPSTAVARLYPQIAEPVGPVPGPNTLEELAAAYEDRVKGQAAVSLEMSDSLVNQMPKTTENAGQGVIPGMPGTAYGGGSAIQPGAALATGGIPALGEMAGSGGGYMGGANAGYPPRK